MASNPTKILAYDLDGDLSKVFDELALIKGEFNSLDERFSNIDVTMLGGDTKLIVQDLLDAYNNDFKGITGERLRTIEGLIATAQTDIGTLQTELNTAESDIVNLNAELDALSFTFEDLEQGNFDESFTYDAAGNVSTHTVTGDRAYTVTYNYKTDGSGELTTSVKEFTDADGNNVQITKTYEYTAGDITGISTATTVTAPTV